MIDPFGTKKALHEAEKRGFTRGMSAAVCTSERENDLRALLTPADAPEFLDACADLAKLGMSADQLRHIAHAMENRRILAFMWGQITDLGETARPIDGKTSGSRPYQEKP